MTILYCTLFCKSQVVTRMTDYVLFLSSDASHFLLLFSRLRWALKPLGPRQWPRVGVGLYLPLLIRLIPITARVAFICWDLKHCPRLNAVPFIVLSLLLSGQLPLQRRAVLDRHGTIIISYSLYYNRLLVYKFWAGQPHTFGQTLDRVNARFIFFVIST